ncbi:MAG: type II secretion protein [Geobacteraceae bacterium GWC2_58_44]|nr:MAG: type II secretion protein [Geobacteraceae bacterium GWC2_58_44]HBG07400.1 type II secretion protein [Geobacter sp.]
MYLNFFNLKKEPFQITPDPSFLYLSPGHKEALASIIYGVEKKKGFILIIGAVGVGKTTILRAYLEKTEKDKLTKIYVFNANISYSSLLKQIFRELGIAPQSNEICEMVNQLHHALINEYREGRNVLLLIDEAQNMPIDTLENLRMLSNLETATEKLIQIVFSAQPEFEKTLNLEELKQLKQRIAVKAVILPLTRQEGLTYIHHRLSTAADKEPVIFTGYALKEIVRVAKGIPRIINVLCDNSLITAFGYGKKKVDIRVVREITRDFGIKIPFYARWRLTLLVGVLLAMAAYWGFQIALLFQAKPIVALQPAKIPVRAEIPPEPEQKDAVGDTVLVQRRVEKGDTLAELIKDVYGYVDSKTIRMVKKANPGIDDENLIIEGDRIVFPVKRGD